MGSKNKDEEFLENFFVGFFGLIKSIFSSFYWGIRKIIKNPVYMIGLAVVIAISLYVNFTTKLWQENDLPVFIKKVLFYNNRILAVWYICCIGAMKNKFAKNYETSLERIGFIGKDGKHPHFIKKEKMGKKEKLVFSSNIPLVEWKAALPRIETALDCNVLFATNGKSKRVVELITIPSECQIPDMLEWRDIYCKRPGIITIGQSAVDSIDFDLDRTPHVLVAGETGSGKSVILCCMLWQTIKQGCKIFMFDFKGGVEFGKQYERYGEVVTTRERALEVLDMLLAENEARLKLFREMEVKNLTQYNKKTNQNLCRICLFSDEIAQMLDKKGVNKNEKAIYEQIEGRLSTLARLSRATGINLFLGVQRPDANILTGQIKNNIPVRICGRFADKSASDIVLGSTDAVNLPDIKGRFLFKIGNELLEFQSYYFKDKIMMKNIGVSVGNMLIEDNNAPNFDDAAVKATQLKTKTPVKKEHKVEKFKPIPELPETKSQKQLEGEIRLMDEMDLNLNFGED